MNRPENFNSQSHSHIKLTHILHFYFDQQDATTFYDLIKTYNDYAKDILDHMQFVIIDDCSSLDISIPDDLNMNILYIRINDDISWNQPGARNLGLVYARSDKVLITDMDHLFPEETLRHLINRKNPGKTIYKFSRMNCEGEWADPHPNTFYMSRARGLQFYGYDEDFSGHYGFDDSCFWRWQRYNGTRFITLGKRYHCCCRDVDWWKAYHNLERDNSYNKELAKTKKEAWKRFGPSSGHSRKFLNFDWTIKADIYRETCIKEPPESKLWAKTWFLRWLSPK